MKTSPPLFSIIVPSRQKGRFLRQALDSLIKQTYPHVEVIVQDCCSTDETATILEAYAPRLAHIYVEQDEGQSDALHRGFARSRGDILGWLNADDLLMPDAVAKAAAAFQAEPGPDVVYGHCALLSAEGQFIRYFHEIQPFSASVLRNRTNFIAQPSTFFTRAAYERVGGIDRRLHYAMDWDLWCRFAESGCRFSLLDEVLSGARQYPETKTGGGGLKRQAEILHVNRRHKTSRLPLAAAAHLYQDHVRPSLPWIHPAARRLWRMLARRRFQTPTPILGLAFPDRVQEAPARLRFPCYAALRGARVELQSTGTYRPYDGLSARLNDQPGTVYLSGRTAVATWQFARPFYAASVELALIPNDFDPARAATHLVEATLQFDDPAAA